MSKLFSESIRGARIEGEVVCIDCLTGDEWEALDDSQVFTEEDVKEAKETYTCERCKDELYGDFEKRKISFR